VLFKENIFPFKTKHNDIQPTNGSVLPCVLHDSDSNISSYTTFILDISSPFDNSFISPISSMNIYSKCSLDTSQPPHLSSQPINSSTLESNQHDINPANLHLKDLVELSKYLSG